MLRFAALCFAVASLFVTTGAQGALIVVSFDDLAPTTTFDPPPAGYGGINWTSADWGLWDSGVSDPTYPAHSDPTVLLTNSVASGFAETEFTFNSPVVFQGAWISGSSVGNFWNLYLNSVLVYTSAVQDATNASTFFPTGYAGLVDQVGVFNDRGFIVLDDFTYETSAVVPEPATLTLVSLGAVGLVAGTIRRRQRKTTVG